MKTRIEVIIIGILAGTGMVMFTFDEDHNYNNNYAYGIWIPQSPEELLEESQVIFVGNITSVNVLEFERSSSYNTEEDGVLQTVIENYTLVLDEYTINVEEFVKNPQGTDTITVRQPTTSIPGRVLPYNGFEVGDRVLFYIKDFDGTNTYSKESFIIPQQCNANSVLLKPRIIGSDFKMMQNGVEKQDNFTADSPITFIARSDMGTIFGASLEYDVYISKQVGKIYKDRVFHEKISADTKLCEWLSVAQWEFTPDVGEYLVNGRIYEDDSSSPIGNKQFSVLPQLPLKQFKSGISLNDVQCRESLVLMAKHDDTPACVLKSTAEILEKRGWQKILQSDVYNKQHVKVSVIGYKYSQIVNESITDFYVKIHGTGYNVHPPKMWINDMNNKTVWNNDHITYLGTGRTLPGDFCKEYTFSDIGGSVIMNSSGNYVLHMSFEGHTSAYGISVKENQTKYNYPTFGEHCPDTLSPQVNGYDNFILTVSNQSLDKDSVDIRVQIDGDVVIDSSFDAGEQHNYYDYGFLLTEGTHTLLATSNDRRMFFEQDFVINGTQFGYLSYWYEKENENPHFELILDNEAFGFL